MSTTTRKPPRNVNLHPQGHSPNSLTQHNFDVIVLGSGPVGRQLGAKTAAKGLSTVIIEAELVGGDCPFWACVPSKALLRPAQALGVARQISGAKELVGPGQGRATVDVGAVFARRDRFTWSWDDTFVVDLTLSQHCSVVRGKGELLGEKKVRVRSFDGAEEATLTATHAVVLATGSEPVIPDIPGLAEVPYWTPREATSANEVPDHLIVLGAGAVGTEMATAYSAYGGEVSLISSSAELLPRQEPEAGKMVREALEEANVHVYVSARAQLVHSEGPNHVAVTLSDGKVVSGSTLLIATGRRPRTRDIGLETLGVAAPLAVNDALGVASDGVGSWLYAIGDTNGLAPTTHMGSYQARTAANVIVARAEAAKAGARPPDTGPWSALAHTADHAAVAQVVFTTPIVASVGLTLAEAQRRGLRAVRAVAVPFTFPGAALHLESNYRGWAQWVVDAERGVLVGATFVGDDAADLVHASTVAIVGEVPVDRLRHAVPSFPTVSEVYTALSVAWEASSEK